MLLTTQDAQLKPDDEVIVTESNFKEFGALAEVEVVGFLVRKTKKEVVVAVSRCHEDQSIRFSFALPAKWVKKIVYLTPKEPEVPPNEPKTSTEVGH